MTPALAKLLHTSLALMPVLCFLTVLVALDSYKLVRLRLVLAVIAAGALAAGLSYGAGYAVVKGVGLEYGTYARYIGPVVEEALKALVLVALIRANRIAFLVDAAIFGFAVGAGFALVENVYFLSALESSHYAIWVVRGFGTATMHGGVQAIFAVAVLSLSERRGRTGAAEVLPPLAIAALLHLSFNQFMLSPVAQTLLMLAVMPPLIWFVYRRSERGLEGWLSTGFDADTELIELINSGAFSESPVGGYLEQLRTKFRGMAIADMLCYLRLHVELAIRAKGLLMQREAGFEVELDEETRGKFAEMRYLEGSVGPTALLALQPFLRRGRQDIWQLSLLDT